MKQGMPWSVKGVDTNARDAAKEAARRAGMTLGEWLNTVIAETAADGEKPDAGIEEKLERLQRAAAETAASAPKGANDLVSVLERAIAQSRQQAHGVEVRTAGAMEAMLRWIERTDRQRRDEMGSLAHAQERTSLALREALTLVTSRLDSMERSFDTGRERELGPMRSALDRLESRMDDLDRRAAEGPLPEKVTESLKLLEGRLVDVARRLDQNPETGVASDRIARIETTLGALVDMLRGPAVVEEDGLLVADEPLVDADDTSLDATLAQIRARQAALDQAAFVARAGADAGDGRTAAQLDALRADIAGLTQRLDDLGRVRHEPDLGAMRQDIVALSSAVRDLSPRHTIEALEGVLRDLARQIEAGRTDSVAQGTSILSLDRLSGDVANLVADLAPLKALGQLRDEIDQLGGRLDKLPQEVSQKDALDRLGAEIADLRGLVESSAAAAQVAAPVEQAVAKLAERLDQGLARHGLDQDVVTSLQKSIEDMRWTLGALTEMERKPDPGLARMEERFDVLVEKLDSLAQRAVDPTLTDIAERMARLQDTVDTRVTPPSETGALGALIASLHEKMDEASKPDAANGSLDALERQIHAMTDALGRTDDNVAALRSMETSIGDLFAKIEDAKRSTIAAAEQAAEQAAERAAEVVAKDIVAKAAPEGERPPQTDRRTSQALEAVQDTMERIVERLAMLEADITSDRVRLMELAERAARQQEEARAVPPAPAPAPMNAAEKIAAAAAAAQAARALDSSSFSRPPRPEPRPSAPPPAPAIPHADALALAAAARASMAPASPAVPPEPAAEEPTVPVDDADGGVPAADGASSAHLADDMLLEPGSGRPAVNEEEQPAANAEPSDAAMASFIASARMAARTATDPSGRVSSKAQKKLDAAERAAAKAAAASAALAAGEEAGGSALSGVRRYVDSRRRPILLGLAALVLAIGSAQLVRNVLLDGTPPAPASQDAPRKDQSSSIDSTTGAPAGAEAKPETAQANPSLLDPNSAAPGSFSTSADKGPKSGALAPAKEPDTVGAIAPAGAPRADVPTGDAKAGVPVSDLPATLPAGLTKAAGLGSPAASYEVASRYFDGRGVTRDLKASVRWFERAATQGFAPAQYRLGSMYEKGLGVQADPVSARNWYRQAADRGNAKAMHNLGVLIAEGSNGKPDYEQAAVWFRRAAELGVRDSQYNLAILTARGLGVAANLQQSYTWFAIAAAQGDEDAGRKRDEVGARLDPATLAAAKAAAESYKPGKLDEAANDPGTPPGGWEGEANAGGKAKPKN
jgi:localization factor PodJL